MSGLQNKLYNYEQTPPEKVWGKIVAALDESHVADKFPSKIYNAEAAPPADAWEKIAGSLNADNSGIPALSQKRFVFLRYAAAAVFIGFVTFTILRLTGRNNIELNKQGKVIAKKSVTSDKKGIVLPNNNIPTDISAEAPSINGEDESSNPVAVTEQPKVLIKKVKAKYAVSDNITAADPVYAYNDDAPNLADRYIMLVTPNGVIRMSKKWGNLVCCVSGQEQDEDCKDQIKKWQEKLACSPATSTGNFIDILSLVSSLDSEL
jgi:hypothetical protein